jgi:Tfp pilus assembly protein PilE
MSPLTYIKQYANAIVAVVLIAIISFITVKFYRIKSERDAAKLALYEAQTIIRDYQKASDDAKKRSADLMALAESHELANADEISALKAQVAKSDEEARRMAIAAGKVIGGLQ